jgi:hypothetical protein
MYQTVGIYFHKCSSLALPLSAVLLQFLPLRPSRPTKYLIARRRGSRKIVLLREMEELKAPKSITSEGKSQTGWQKDFWLVSVRLSLSGSSDSRRISIENSIPFWTLALVLGISLNSWNRTGLERPSWWNPVV